MQPSRSCARFGIAIYVSLLLILLATRFAPFISNRDDFVRYYFGGYVGSVQIRGGEKSRTLREQIEKAASSLPSAHDKLRFDVGRTPYVPIFLATTPIGMALFEQLSGIHPATWILVFHTALWTLGILASTLFVLGNPRLCSASWFLAAGVAVAWLNVHTSPFVPVPRGVSTLAAGLALACYLTEPQVRYATVFLALGSLFHPFQHIMNVALIFLFIFAISSPRPMAFLRSASTWRIGASTVLAALVGVAIVWFANAMSWPSVTSMLDARAEYDVRGNWSVNQEVFEISCRNLGPVLLVIVLLERGWKRMLGCGALFVGSLLAAALLGPSGAYPGEYVHRVAAMWSAILFALLLKRDLFRELMGSIAGKRPWAAIGIVLACLLFLWRSFDAWNPGTAWKQFVAPSAKEWGPVETECLRMLTDPV